MMLAIPDETWRQIISHAHFPEKKHVQQCITLLTQLEKASPPSNPDGIARLRTIKALLELEARKDDSVYAKKLVY